jgi:hypothetical protein
MKITDDMVAAYKAGYEAYIARFLAGGVFDKDEATRTGLEAVAALSTPAPASTGEAVAWQELLDKGDRTSPEDYPDMALITREELAEFIDRATTPAQPAVAIKPLEWRDRSSEDVDIIAHHPWGEYHVTKNDSYEWPFLVRPFITQQSNYETLEEAKADCEADYEARIRSALVAPASPALPLSDFRIAGQCNCLDCLNIRRDAHVKREADRSAASPAPVAEGWGSACRHLEKMTFAVQHNPNCPSPWLVRLPGKGPLDLKHYGDPFGLTKSETGDILGFGKTFEEAASAALAARPAAPSQPKDESHG